MPDTFSKSKLQIDPSWNGKIEKGLRRMVPWVIKASLCGQHKEWEGLDGRHRDDGPICMVAQTGLASNRFQQR